ncbi:MAG TPA: Calx-beta domain-containing protein, partial [Phycisphaerae bacterium]|nr:Calx-beta domain-containing protein [Phycisphaerae bacterium]
MNAKVLVGLVTFAAVVGAAPAAMSDVSPVTVQNPWVVNDRIADCRTITTIANTFVNSYQPDGVTPPSSDEERAINCYNNYKRRVYHWADQPPDMWDTVTVVNLFGTVLCGRHAAHNNTILDNVPEVGHRLISLPGHWIYEAYYDGAWHALDTMCTMYAYNRATPPALASCEELKQDGTLLSTAVAEGRACPGFLLCGDSVEGYNGMLQSWGDGGSGVQPTDHSMGMGLRLGELVDRTWQAWPNQHPPAITDADGIPGADPPYHHEAQHDWKDYVNWPYWEPYGLVDPNIAGTKTTFRRWANGTMVLEPDFRTAGYQACVEDSSNIATYNDDGLTPDLHLAATGSAYVVFKIDCPFYLTDGTIDGTFVRNDSGDANRIYFSTDGVGWTLIWDNTATGTTQLDGLSLRNYVYQRFRDYWIKIELDADGSITDAGVSDLAINTIFQHNKHSMAALDKGTNNLTVTFDNPTELQASGASFKVVYSWKEYDGADWTIAKSYETYITGSPTNFQITTGGSKVPRTESIVLGVTPPPIPDGVPPAAITDLDALNPDSTTIDLTWTATGDDGTVGRAMYYDLRYRTSTISEANWDTCTEVQGELSPQDAGSTEYFTVTGLNSSTTYYFAIKAYDEGGQGSDLSNVTSETTLAPDVTAPAAITDLFAASAVSPSAAVDLSWTAPGDDGSTGTAASYDIRYSTSSIDEGNWASATEVTGEPAPQAGGSAESFTITGLTIGTTYYFAIKTSDEVPNESGLSNVASADALLGEKVLSPTADTYLSQPAPDIAYGTGYERMRVCGYADIGDNRERGLVRFDLSSIPAGTNITNATLWLWSYNPPQVKGDTGYYGAYRVTSDWTEGGSTWNVPWGTPGGDFEVTEDGLAPKQSAAQAPCWYSFNLTARAQQWIDNPSGNYGWIIKCTDEMLHNQDEFYQKETGNAQYRPNLVVTDLSQYIVTAQANPSEGGTVTGGGSYSYGSTAIVEATPNTYYEFLNWTGGPIDGSTNPLESFTVYDDVTVTANFQGYDCLITVLASPTAGGEVTGGGLYNINDSCNVTATPDTGLGYTFVNWSGGPIDGSTNLNESFTVTQDETITAIFQGPAGIIDVTNFEELNQAIRYDSVPGDTIRVQPGIYELVAPGQGRLSFYNAGEPGNPITILGVMEGGQRPILQPAAGEEINRGFFFIWPVDHDWVIENLEFRNNRGGFGIYSPNAAGIYNQGDRITIRNCYFHHNDQGISSAVDAEDTLIELSEIYANGTDLNFGYSHGIYILDTSATIRGCYFHDGYGGMLFKNRCAHHVLEYCWLETDGSEAFVAATSSVNDNNSLWRGNVFIKRSTPGGQRRILSFCDSPSMFGTCTLINNAVISATSSDIYMASTVYNQADLVLKNNVFAGPSDILFDWQSGGGTITGNNNVFRTAMQPDVPAGVVDSIFSNDPGFVSLGSRDFHLTSGSICRNAGLNNPTWKNESQQWVDGTPQYEPTTILTMDGRYDDGVLDIGAYEYTGVVLPTVAFDLTASSGDESVTPANLAVSLSASSTDTVTVDYAVTGGTATGGGVDYTLAAGMLTFDPGVTTQNVPITIVDDGEDEANETVEVTLSNPGNATLGINTVHTYTILDNDVAPLPSVEFDLTASSGDESVTPANLAVSLSASSVNTVTVDYAVTGGTATGGGVDYTLAAGMLTFDPGVTTQNVPITIVDDAEDEADETVEVTLSNPVSATLGANTVHTYTILDNDEPVGDGTGLTGQYYDNMDFTALTLTRVDTTVNFDWATGSPDASIGV